MTEDQYRQELRVIEEAHRRSLKDLAFKYVKENAKFKIGDIIKYDNEIIIVNKIGVYMSLGRPEAMYSGTELKKDLTPKKNQMGRTFFGSWGIELIKSTLTTHRQIGGIKNKGK